MLGLELLLGDGHLLLHGILLVQLLLLLMLLQDVLEVLWGPVLSHELFHVLLATKVHAKELVLLLLTLSDEATDGNVGA